jgi:uncharacterized membrane protein
MIFMRALRKSLSFRLFATIGTFAVAWIFTGNPFTSLGLAGAQAVTNTTIYYAHEKAWEQKNPIGFLAPVKRIAFNLEKKDKPKEPIAELSKEQKEHLRKHGDFL